MRNISRQIIPVAWIAGFSEGEGCFTIHSNWNNTTRNSKRMYYKCLVPVYNVSQKERQPLDMIKKFWEAEGVNGKVWFKNNEYGGAYEYRALGLKNAEVVYKVLLPHMHSRRKIKQMTTWIKRARTAHKYNHPTDKNIFSFKEKKQETI